MLARVRMFQAWIGTISRLLVLSLPKAVLLSTQSVYFGVARFATVIDYAALNWQCLFALVGRHISTSRDEDVQHFAFMGYRCSCFSLWTALTLVNEVVLRRVYGIDKDLCGRPLTIIDCGSNIGISILFFKKICPTAEILGFEPDPDTFRLATENVSVNRLEHVQLEELALGEEEKWVRFYRDPHTRGSLASSTVARGDSWIDVHCVRLSEYITGRVDLLKLDIEGAEESVIRDLTDTGKVELIDRIIMEYHPRLAASHDASEVLNRLESHGFRYYTDRNGGKDDRPFHIYCYNEERLSRNGDRAGFVVLGGTK